MLILFQYQHYLKVNTFFFQGNTAAAQLGALNMNPAYRNLAPQQLTAAQQQQLLLQQGLNPSQVVTKMITFFLKFVSSFPFSAQLASVPAALEGWAHRGTGWRCEPSISCQHGGADATPGSPTIQVNVTLNFILNHVVTFVTTGRAVLRTSLSLGS